MMASGPSLSIPSRGAELSRQLERDNWMTVPSCGKTVGHSENGRLLKENMLRPVDSAYMDTKSSCSSYLSMGERRSWWAVASTAPAAAAPIQA